MVGLGQGGEESALARVSIVNYHGHVVLDTFVQPRERVTDFRTWVSGVRESDVMNAPPLDDVQKQVAGMIKDKILIGHAVENDLKVSLQLCVPLRCVADDPGAPPLASESAAPRHAEVQAAPRARQDETTRFEEADGA